MKSAYLFDVRHSLASRFGAVHNHRVWWSASVAVLDACAIVAALVLVRLAYTGTIDPPTVQLALFGVTCFLLLAQFTGLYRRTQLVTLEREVAGVLSNWLLTVVTLSLVALATRGGQWYPRLELFTWFLLTPVIQTLCRAGARMIQQGWLRQRGGTRRVAIAGMNRLGVKVARELETNADLGWRLTGFYDDRVVTRDLPATLDQAAAQQTLAGNLTTLVEQARAGGIDIVLLTLPMRAEQRIRDLLRQLSDSTVSVYVVPDIFVFDLLHSRWTHFNQVAAVSIFESPLDGVDGVAKRATDLAVASFALAVFAIPMLAIAIGVKLSSPGPVLFCQRRYGLDGREIGVWKFRSMRACDNGPVVKQATKDDPRITRFGAFLRKTSLDELPQLFNVIGGSMSLVGPRPHATAHNEAYRGQIQGYMLRHKVKPGITGLAQVNGCRGETDTLDKMERRVEYDHQYIRGWSLGLDIRILFKTLWVAWRQPEAY